MNFYSFDCKIFNEETRKWYYAESLDLTNILNDPVFREKIRWFTGAHDINGNKIFSNDRIEYSFSMTASLPFGITGKVIWLADKNIVITPGFYIETDRINTRIMPLFVPKQIHLLPEESELQCETPAIPV